MFVQLGYDHALRKATVGDWLIKNACLSNNCNTVHFLYLKIGDLQGN